MPKRADAERVASEVYKANAVPKAGQPIPHLKFISWHIDVNKYQVTPFLMDGTWLPPINLRPLFEAYFMQTNS
jgi:hypothetical protein